MDALQRLRHHMLAMLDMVGLALDVRVSEQELLSDFDFVAPFYSRNYGHAWRPRANNMFLTVNEIPVSA
eukprot:3731486-Rhodomonas_salina.1